MKSKLLNYLLLITFILTIMVPFTGIVVHKLSSTMFLLLCLVHVIVYRKKMKGKRFLLIGLVLVSFLSGLFGMIFEEIPLILALHKGISIAVVFFMAIHIFVFYRKLK